MIEQHLEGAQPASALPPPPKTRGLPLVGSLPAFQLRCGTPFGKTISEPGGHSCCCPSISMLIVPLST